MFLKASTATLVLTLSLSLFQSASASAQTLSAYTFNYNPWNVSTFHDITFTNIEATWDYERTLLGLCGSWAIVYGIGFRGITTNRSMVEVAIIGPGGNLIGPGVDSDSYRAMRAMVLAFHQDTRYNSPTNYYHSLAFKKLEKKPYTGYRASSGSSYRTGTSVTILANNPVAEGSPDFDGGVVEITVHTTGDFSLESLIRRDNGSNGAMRTSCVSVLRNSKAFILNRDMSFTTLHPPTGSNAAMFAYYCEVALNGRPWISISGGPVLEDDGMFVDPYHVARGGVGGAKTKIIDSTAGAISLQGDGR